MLSISFFIYVSICLIYLGVPIWVHVNLSLLCPLDELILLLLSIYLYLYLFDFPDSSVGKEYACNAGDRGSVPELGRSPFCLFVLSILTYHLSLF